MKQKEITLKEKKDVLEKIKTKLKKEIDSLTIKKFEQMFIQNINNEKGDIRYIG